MLKLVNVLMLMKVKKKIAFQYLILKTKGPSCEIPKPQNFSIEAALGQPFLMEEVKS